MNNNRVIVVDYGVGNLYSVRRALEVCGASDIGISSDPAEVLDAERVVLPGVGAFAEGMRGLHERGLDRTLCEFARSGRPLLGICLGMQLFATASMEFGKHTGLGLIPGQVVAIPSKNKDGRPLKTPYTGWSSLDRADNAVWEGSALALLSQNEYIYLVHSFHVIPDSERDILAIYEYGGHKITAAIKKDNITGVQFHPEKSGEVGLSILETFLKQEPDSGMS